MTYVEELVSLKNGAISAQTMDAGAILLDMDTKLGTAEEEMWEKLKEITIATQDLKKTQLTPAVVVVDPFSSGIYMAHEIAKLGYRLITVNSQINAPFAKYAKETIESDYIVQHDDETEDEEGALRSTIQQVKNLPYTIYAVLPGSEPGVKLADILADALDLRVNEMSLSDCRRSKFSMNEQVRKCGVRAVRQCYIQTYADLEKANFFDNWPGGVDTPTFKVVIKPNESVGTDDVYVCTSTDMIKEKLSIIDGKINGLGTVNSGALVQEFLEGTEYVVDSVSRDGIHKVTAVWEYDKRDVNGANFVYFGMRLRAVDDEDIRQLVQYNFDVLDALRYDNGPTHAEIKITPTGPCLIEVGARVHGGGGTWLPIVNDCIGYNQVDTTIDAYLKPERFETLPLYVST